MQEFPGPGSARRVSRDGGIEPIWARDGKRLYYRAGIDFVEATLQTSPVFAVVGHQKVFSQFAEAMPNHANDDVSRSNQLLIVGPGKESEVLMVSNWMQELRERLKSVK